MHRFLAILRFYQSTDSTITTGDTELGTDPVGGLDPSESGGGSIILTAPDTAGTYYYGACVEEAVTTESDTTNNCSLAIIVTVGAAPAPDLVMDSPTVDISAPAAGASFTLSAKVRNQGNALDRTRPLCGTTSRPTLPWPPATLKWAQTPYPASTRQRAETSQSA